MPLEYRLEVDDKGTPKLVKFRGETKKTMGSSEKLSKAILGVGAGMAAMGTAAVAGGAAMFKVASDTAKTRDEITKISRELGTSTEHLSGMSHALQLGGTDLKTYEKGLARLSKNVLDADRGLATATQGFSELGISIKDSNGVLKTNEQLVFEVADQFQKMPDGVIKSAKAQELFGKSGKSLINTLNLGAEGIKAQTDEAKKMGLVFDQEAGEAAEKFNDTLLRLQQTGGGAMAEMGEDLIPLITTAMDDLTDTVEILAPVATDFLAGSLDLIRWILPELTDMALGWSQILKDVSSFNKVDFSDSGFEELNEQNKEFIKTMEKVGATQEENAKKAEQAAKQEARVLQQKEIEAQRAAEKRQKSRAANQKKQAKEEEAILKAQLEAELDAEIELDNMLTEMEEKEVERKKETALEIAAIEREITLSLMSESEKREFLFNEEYAKRVELIGNTAELQKLKAQEVADVEKLKAEENRMMLEENAQTVLEIGSNLSDSLGMISDMEQQRVENRYNERTELLEEQREAEIKSAGNDEAKKEAIRKKFDDRERQLENKKNKDLLKAKKKFANEQKAIATGEAIIAGALAATRAYAEGGPILGPILAAAIALKTGLEISTIQAQEFFAGGNTGDSQRLISVGENGNEFVVSGGGTRAAGDDALNDINNGRIEDAANKLAARSGRSGGGMTLNLYANVIDQNFVQDSLVPALQEYERRQ